MLQELLRRSIEERASGCRRSPHNGDHVAFHQRTYHIVRIDTADGFNLGLRHRLLVRNHRQTLQRRHRELSLGLLSQHLAKPRRVLRQGCKLVAARNFHNVHRTIRLSIFPVELLNDVKNRLLVRAFLRQLTGFKLPEDVENLPHGKRFISGKHQRFDDLLECCSWFASKGS